MHQSESVPRNRNSPGSGAPRAHRRRSGCVARKRVSSDPVKRRNLLPSSKWDNRDMCCCHRVRLRSMKMSSTTIPDTANASDRGSSGRPGSRCFVFICVAAVSLVPFLLLLVTQNQRRDVLLATRLQLGHGSGGQLSSTNEVTSAHRSPEQTPLVSTLAPGTPFSWRAVESYSREFAKDRQTPTLLALLVDLVRRRSAALDVLSAGGAGAGRYIRAGRAGAADLESNVAAARSVRDCRRQSLLPVTCLLTSGEAAFLQEWLAWHIAQVSQSAVAVAVVGPSLTYSIWPCASGVGACVGGRGHG